MKRLVTILMLGILLLTMSGCSEKPVQPDTPLNTAWMTKLAISNGNYEQFNSFFLKDVRIQFLRKTLMIS